VTDAELIRRLGVPEKIAYAAIHALDRDKGSGFPQKQAVWGKRRYWPAVSSGSIDGMVWAGAGHANRSLGMGKPCGGPFTLRRRSVVVNR